jgi:uncharacterized protein
MVAVTLLLALAAVFTAILSAVFGMAGGLVLLGVYTALLPVPAAMVLHGVTQLVANGSRAILQRRHIAWRSVGAYGVGAIAAWGLLWFVPVPTDPAVVLILAGSTPFLARLIAWHPDGAEPRVAVFAGFLVQTLNVLAGVAGPLLDVFFVESKLDRYGIVATKAATQAISHAAKIGFWASLVDGDLRVEDAGATVVAALVGTWLGSRLLDHIDEALFRKATKTIVLVLGGVYVIRGVIGLLSA